MSQDRLAARKDALEREGAIKEAHFDDLVRRHQDMACACAYAVLGNLWLAEDVAQEAFITAWQKLDQLREPAAFPGWLRRIVLTHCHRLTRGKRVALAPLDAGAEVASRDPDPHAVLERGEAEAGVRSLLTTLPEGERIVALLYYMADYSQAEIGECLGLRPTAVAKRLFSARRRLESRALEMFARSLRNSRPSRSAVFEDAVFARLRPLVPPVDDPRSRPIGDKDSGLIERRYVAEGRDSTAILGYGAIEQSIYLPRYRLSLVVDPQHLRSGIGALLMDRLLDDLREADAVTVSIRVISSRHELLSFLTERGFEETSRVWEMRLTLSDAWCARASAAAARVAANGIDITTLAAERRRDAACVEKLHDLVAAIEAPDRRVAPPAFDLKEALIWMEPPYVLPDAYFIAMRHGEYIGVCDVNSRGAAAGELVHGFTGVRPEHRRQGVATALKTAAAEYARRHGYKVLRAFNRPAHAAIMAVNLELGFRRGTSDVTLERCLKQIARVDPSVYDAYVGRYRVSPADDAASGDDAARGGDVARGFSRAFTITKEDDRLFAEFAGQKVELFPESATTFFVKYFYGWAELDGTGRLLWRERDRSSREVTVCATRIG